MQNKIHLQRARVCPFHPREHLLQFWLFQSENLVSYTYSIHGKRTRDSNSINTISVVAVVHALYACCVLVVSLLLCQSTVY